MKGTYRPHNPQKYRGNVSNIIYRSSWELRVMSWLDKSPDIKSWSSEEVVVLYTDYSSSPPRTRRYFPDFTVEKTNGQWMMVEIKPLKQALPPTSRKRQTTAYINEVKTYAKNMSKWEAAKKYCEQRGWRFVVLTERDLGIKV